MAEERILSREELYELAWTIPMRTLARDLGLSDVGLAKLCRRHRIPTPSRGYWARNQAGQEPPRARMAKLDNGILDKIVIAARPKVVAGAEPPQKLLVEVSNDVALHPVVERTLSSLRAARAGADGRVRPRAQTALPIIVATERIDRAVTIANGLVLALESRGHEIEVASDERASSFVVKVFGEKLSVALEEDLDREVIELTDRQKREKEKNPWLYRNPEYRYFPSGRLVFRIDRQWSEGIRKRFADGKKRRLEDLLGEAIVNLESLATKLQDDRRKREEEERRRREWEAERASKLELIEKEEEKLKALDRQVDAWHRSQRIRAFLEAVRTAWKEARGGIPPGSEVEAWLAWGAEQADRLDPLAKSPPSILDEKAKWQKSWYGW